MLPPQLQDDGNPQVAALMQQLQQMDGHAKQAVGQLQQQLQQVNQQLEAEKQKNMQGMAKLQIDARKADIDGYAAETDRIQAVQQSMTPEQVQMLVIQTLQSMMNNPDITPGVQQ